MYGALPCMAIVTFRLAPVEQSHALFWRASVRHEFEVVDGSSKVTVKEPVGIAGRPETAVMGSTSSGV